MWRFPFIKTSLRNFDMREFGALGNSMDRWSSGTTHSMREMSLNYTYEKKWNDGVMEEWNIGWFEKITLGLVLCKFDPSFHYSTLPIFHW